MHYYILEDRDRVISHSPLSLASITLSGIVVLDTINVFARMMKHLEVSLYEPVCCVVK